MKRGTLAAREGADGSATTADTLLKHLVERLEQSRQIGRTLEHVVDRIADAVFAVDGSWTIRYWAAGAAALFDLPEDRAVGRTLPEILGPDVLAPSPPWEGIVRWKGSPYRLVLTAVPDDGEGPWDRQAPGTWACALVAEKRLASLEEDVERMRPLADVGRLLATVLHELRNPLSVIEGTASLLLRQGRDAGPVHLRRLLDASGIIHRLIEDVLVLARPIRPRTRSFALVPLLTESFRDAVCEAPDTILTDFRTDGSRPTVVADPDLVRQILGNLVRNALEAMGKEGVVTVQAASGPAGRARVIVRDTGPGIEPGAIGRVFEPFHTTKAGGTGLGLATARRLAEAMGGSLDVVASPRRGASFVLELPSRAEGDRP